MHPKSSRAFMIYMGLGPSRSLVKAVEACRQSGLAISLATLKRYSARDEWQRRAREIDKQASDRILTCLAKTLPNAATVELARELQLLERYKERFNERLNIDPDDPTLTPRQRRRALNPTLKDFGLAIKLEQELRKLLGLDQPSRKPASPSDFSANLSDVIRTGFKRMSGSPEPRQPDASPN